MTFSAKIKPFSLMFLRLFSLTAIALCLDLTILTLPALSTTIEGIVFSPKGPLPGAIVSAYPDYASLIADKNGIQSIEGEKPGQFTMQIDPGRYYMVAHGNIDSTAMFSYHGINPITITDDPLWIPFFAIKNRLPRYLQGPTGIHGEVTYKDNPLSGGTVSVYSLSDKQFRGMGLLTNTLDVSGRFQFDLEPGTYVVVARKREADSGMGPLGDKDLFCYPAANPIHIETETITEIHISCYPRNNLEGFLDADGLDPRGRKMAGRRTSSLEDTEINLMPNTQDSIAQDSTSISGRVTDLQGKPLEGLYVAAYPANGNLLFQMHILRLLTPFITKTDNQGRYFLLVNARERYYLVARELLGEAPIRSEFYGLYEGNSNLSIDVWPRDQKADMNIIVDRIMP